MLCTELATLISPEVLASAISTAAKNQRTQKSMKFPVLGVIYVKKINEVSSTTASNGPPWVLATQ